MFCYKLIVFWLLNEITCIYGFNYCDLCLNHTLCKYSHHHPSKLCKNYDTTSSIDVKDATEIVDRINMRRNSVATGQFGKLPKAANMRKIVWSPELAVFAQRWAYQCDQSVYPDKKDECRDTAESTVFQSIATVLGSSPGLEVKSFIDIWYMKAFDYAGSVSYYNQSVDHKWSSFTQLIWAETASVGCGRARFNHNTRNIVIDRLVCNFSPGGNIHGKPVYTIGFSVTQCPDVTSQDRDYQGLCSSKKTFEIKRHKNNDLPIPIFMKMFNLSNGTKDIDPVRNNIRNFKYNNHAIKNRRNQKTRHVFPNEKPEAKVFPRQMNAPNNFPLLHQHMDKFNPQGRANTRLYHGIYQTIGILPVTPRIIDPPGFRRYPSVPPILTPMDSRRLNNMPIMCTRKPQDYDLCGSNRCTRGNVCGNCYISTQLAHLYPQNICPCTKQSTVCQNVCSTMNTDNCQCFPKNCAVTQFPNHYRRQDYFMNTKPIGDLHYYDMVPNVAFRSGNNGADVSTQKTDNERFLKANNYDYLYNDRNTQSKRVRHTFHQVKNIDQKNTDSLFEEYFTPYHSFSSRKRKKRLPDNSLTWLWKTYKPKRNALQLKSLKYTTLSNKKHKKSKRTSTLPLWITQELITFTTRQSHDLDHVTEKFLSFEELMHLRKITDLDYNGRRADTTQKTSVTTKTTAKVTTTTKPATSAMTTVTTAIPFVRNKVCTRKVSCTWTVALMPAGLQDNLSNSSDEFGWGTRTPPDFVDGCTRTFTCSRPNMGRNKVTTKLTTNVESEKSTALLQSVYDESEYCWK